MSEGNQQSTEYLANLAELKKSAAFKWYVENCIKPAYDKAHAKLHSTKTDIQERHTQAFVFEAIEEILEWPDKQFEHWGNARIQGM